MAFTGPASVGPNTGSVTTAVDAAKVIVHMKGMISHLEPNLNPLLRLTAPSDDPKAVLRRRAVTNPKFQLLEHRGTPMWDAINFGAGYNNSDVSVVVDNGAYFGDSTASGFRVLVPRTGEIFTVTSRTGNTLTIVRHTGADTLVEDEPLVILGVSAIEGSGAPAIQLTQEDDIYNLTEIIKTPFGATGTLQATKLYGGPDLSVQQFYKGIEHAKQLEYRLLFGQRDTVTTSSDMKRFTGGLDYYIVTNITTDTGGLSEAEWNTWLQTFFRYGTKQKIVLMGSAIVNVINGYATGKIRINDILTKKYGLDITQFLTPYGTAYLVYHVLMEGATYSKRAYGVDLNNFEYVYLAGRDTRLFTNIQANDEDKREDQFMTEMGADIGLEETHAELNIA